MTLLNETINLSRLYGVKPTKNRGQNFLIDENIYEEIIDAAKIQTDEVILEIGPGLGFLTNRLAKKSKKVMAVELDKKLAEALANRLEIDDIKNVEIFNEDIMNFTSAWEKSLKKYSNDKIIVVANLPYTITSIFLRHFVGGNIANILPSRFILMLQKEVAERIIARAGKMSILALSIQLYARPTIIKLVSKKSFWPSPQVDSAIILLERNNDWLNLLKEQKGTDQALLRLMKVGFSARRKMLKANLAVGYKLPVDKILEQFTKANIKLTARPQELGLKDWLKLLPLFS
jgi:16S rRNA (adenine1518-N6/adenine1519-N6)-dimethyltransferase